MTVNVLCPSGHSWDCEACRYCEEGRGTLRAHMTCKREVSPVIPNSVPTDSVTLNPRCWPAACDTHLRLRLRHLDLILPTSPIDCRTFKVWDCRLCWFCQYCHCCLKLNPILSLYLWPSLNFIKFTIWICLFEWIHHTIEIIWVGAPWLSFAYSSNLGKQGCCFNWVQVIIFIFLPRREATHILDSLILAEYCRRVFLPF